MIISSLSKTRLDFLILTSKKSTVFIKVRLIELKRTNSNQKESLSSTCLTFKMMIFSIWNSKHKPLLKPMILQTKPHK